MADQATEDGRAKALKYYKILALVLGVLGVGMLVCAIVATLNVDEDVFGPPYFIGGYTVGVMAIFSALICTCVIMKGGDISSDVKKQELGCAMQGHYLISMFMLMGCFVGLTMAGIGGFVDADEMSPLNKNLAIVILIGCILGFIVTIASMCLVCTYGRYFGVMIQRGRRRHVITINTNNTTAPTHTNTTIFQTQPVNTAHVNQLQMENQLLQQQLELQRQLNQQQQQQPQQQAQYGGGFSDPAYPPPPPMYPPPPRYEDVK